MSYTGLNKLAQPIWTTSNISSTYKYLILLVCKHTALFDSQIRAESTKQISNMEWISARLVKLPHNTAELQTLNWQSY